MTNTATMAAAPTRLAPGAAWVVIAASALGVAATYWDDAWHTTLGRDNTFIPPHLLLYGSMAIVGVVLARWVLLAWADVRSVRAVFVQPGVGLAVVAGTMTAAAAPADSGWHAAFGRDAVLWSPPHLVSVLAMVALLIAAMLGVDRSVSPPLRAALGAVLLGAVEIVVLEYDSGVPQFSETIYLPILLLTALAAAWVFASLLPGPHMLSYAVAGYTAYRLTLWAVLSIAGWHAPDLPVALLGLLVLDGSARWGRSRWPAAALAVVALQLAASGIGASSVRFAPTSISAAVVVPVLAVALAVALGQRWSRAALIVTALMALTPSAAPVARAHDPGQGLDIANAQLTLQHAGPTDVVVLVDDLEGDAATELRPLRLLARRAGQTISGELAAATSPPDRPAFRGEITLPSSGLWFIYAELQHDGQTVETWVPIDRDTLTTVSEHRAVYLPVGTGPRPPIEYIAGGGLLAAGTLVLGWAAVLVARHRRHRPTTAQTL